MIQCIKTEYKDKRYEHERNAGKQHKEKVLMKEYQFK